MLGETVRAFGHAINSEYQLAMIRLPTTHADVELRDMCTGWVTRVDRKIVQVR